MLDNLQGTNCHMAKKNLRHEKQHRHRSTGFQSRFLLPYHVKRGKSKDYISQGGSWPDWALARDKRGTEKHTSPLSCIPCLRSGLLGCNFIPVISRGDKVIFTTWPATQGRYSCSCGTEGILSRLQTVEHHSWLCWEDQRKKAQRYNLWSPRARLLQWKKTSLCQNSSAAPPALGWSLGQVVMAELLGRRTHHKCLLKSSTKPSHPHLSVKVGIYKAVYRNDDEVQRTASQT